MESHDSSSVNHPSAGTNAISTLWLPRDGDALQWKEKILVALQPVARGISLIRAAMGVKSIVEHER
jgi:hypothetical protein